MEAVTDGVAVMVKEKYGVRLAPEWLEHLIRAKSSARITARARILLKTDAGWKAVAEALDVSVGTVFRSGARRLPNPAG